MVLKDAIADPAAHWFRPPPELPATTKPPAPSTPAKSRWSIRFLKPSKPGGRPRIDVEGGRLTAREMQLVEMTGVGARLMGYQEGWDAALAAVASPVMQAAIEKSVAAGLMQVGEERARRQMGETLAALVAPPPLPPEPLPALRIVRSPK